MSAYLSGRCWYSKVTVAPGADGRRTYQLAKGLDEAGAVARDALLTELAAGLRAVTTPAPLDPERVIDPLLAKLAGADAAEAARVEAYIRQKLLPGRRKPRAEIPTVQQFGEAWTSGELARRYPGRVKVCVEAKAEAGKLARHVYRHIGDVLVSAVRLEDLEKVLHRLPAAMATSTKRLILSRLHRLLDLAVYPAKLLGANPMPEGFLPRATRRAFVYLYPAEEAALLGCRAVSLVRRVAYGLAARLGLRVGEVCGLRWADVDLERGALRLGEHKTAQHVGARVVPLDEPTVRVLRWWQRAQAAVVAAEQGRAGRSVTLKPGHVVGWGIWIGDRTLDDLTLAGVLRGELHTTTKHSKGFSFHGFRRTFVTLALGAGRSEDWVMRRTGHTSSVMLGRYRIAAATAAEFQLGWLVDFDAALPEFGGRVGERVGAGVTDTPPARSVRGGAETRKNSSIPVVTIPTPSARERDGGAENTEKTEGTTWAPEGLRTPADSPRTGGERPRRPLRRVGVSARRAAASGLLTARLAREVRP